MSSPETAGATTPSLARDWLKAVRYWLRGPQGLAALILSALVIGAALNWSWLVAVGVAPLLLTVLPCAAMCALGLCMNRMGGGACSSKETVAGEEVQQATRPEALPAAVPDPNQPTLGLDDGSTGASPALVAPRATEGATGTRNPEEERIHA